MKKLLLTTLLLLVVTMSGIAQKMKNVTVSTPDDFIKAIAPNTNITIKSNGILAITSALDKMSDDRDLSDFDFENVGKLAPGVYFSDEADGRSIKIVNINNLSIVGANPNREDNHIQANPSYADVLMFINCNNITVKNIKAGHVEKGYCVGDVISFSNCKNSNIDNCDLYGCGVNGLSMYETSGLKVSNTEIHDCSENMVVISDCQNISFIKCSMHNCGAGIATWGDKNANITYEECEIIEPVYDDEYYGDYEGGEGDYGYEGNCPNELMEAMNAAGSIFEKKLNNNLVNGALYEEFDEECGYIVIPEDGDWYAAYLPQINDDGQYEFLFLDNVNVKNGEKMFFGSCHVVVNKKEGRFSYEIRDNALESVTSITGTGNNQTYSHGKDKNSLKKCTKQEAMKHFEFDYELIDVEDARKTDEVYPWG